MTVVNTELGYAEESYGETPYASGSILAALGCQANVVNDASSQVGAQAEIDVGTATEIGAQAQIVVDFIREVAAQANIGNSEAAEVAAQVLIELATEGYVAAEALITTLSHYPKGTYLVEPYLEEPYLVAQFCAALASQATVGSGTPIASQARIVLYNTNKLRVLCDFLSRGTTGTNWTSTNTEAGDFDVNNLNTDIVEQYWRSEDSVLAVSLTCDTEITQGAFVDTIGILNHNLTSSATITLLGADNPTFSPVGTSIALEHNDDEIIYVAPEAPTERFRYWRFVISDVTNPDNFLRIGTIVFGESKIFVKDCFTDDVQFGYRHFKDGVFTEGFTNVTNDRGIKRYLSLDFQSIDHDGPDFQKYREIIFKVKTQLKALWIPDPQNIYRLSLFAKIAQLPSENHRDLGGSGSDLVSFGLDLDESL